MTRDEAGRLVAICVATWPNHPVGDPAALVSAWELALADAPYGMGQRAVALYLREGRFFPAPAEIRALVVDRLGVLPAVAEAWGLVVRRMRETYPGHPATPWAAPRPVREAVEAMGGMHALRLSDEPGMDQARFAKVYATYRERAARDLDVAALVAGDEAEALAVGGVVRGEPVYPEPKDERAPASGRVGRRWRED